MGTNIVIEDRHGDEARTGAAQHLPDGGRTGVAAADDGHTQADPTRPSLPREES